MRDGMRDEGIPGTFIVRLLGPFDVWRSDGLPLTPLRTQKGQWLLALLALRLGRGVPRDWLAGLLWPASTDTLALYNLRRCLSDLRHALGPDAWRLNAPTTRSIALNLSEAHVDVLFFDAAVAAIKNGDRAQMEAAVRVYRGPLLEGCDEGWLTPERVSREEGYLTMLERLAAIALAAGDIQAAIAHLRRVVAWDPTRETAQRALLLALDRSGDHASSIAAYRSFRRYLRDELNIDPSPETQELMQHILNQSRSLRIKQAEVPLPAPDIGEEPDPAGGALPLDSRLYVERAADEAFRRAVLRGDSIVLVKGPRQVGKTSLLSRGLQAARAAGRRVCVMDFQKLTAKHLESTTSFFLALADHLAERLNLDVSPEAVWNVDAGPNENLERYLRRYVLGGSAATTAVPLIWGFDEVDRLFTCSFGNEVFALFRSWHNERALDPGGPWSRLTLAISYATEAHLFITDPKQSPFNIGTRLTLEDFTREGVGDLAHRYGDLPTPDPTVPNRIFALVGGHPYLVHRILQAITAGLELDDLEAVVKQEGGPLDDHLRHLGLLLQRDRSLSSAVGDMLLGKPCPSGEPFYRLRSAGVIVGNAPETARLRCRLYVEYLERRLGLAGFQTTARLETA